MDVILDDVEVSELWIQSKMVRRAAWNSNKVLVDMLSDLVGPDPIGRSQIPPSCVLRPLSHGEHRDLRNGDGAYIVDGVTGTVTPVLQAGFHVTSLLVINNLIDRCAIGGSGVWFLIFGMALCMSVNWGIHHDAWNAIKNGSKKTSSGAAWRSVVRFAAVANLRFGPRRSGAWGSKMKEAHSRMVERLHCRHPRFMRAAEAQQVLEPGRFNRAGACDYEAWWCFFGSLPSCTSSDCPVLKFSRWMGIGDCWDHFRREWFLLQIVLEELACDGGYDVEALLEGATDRWDDATRKAASADDKREGLIGKAHTYVSFDVAQGMDIFGLAQAGLREDYSHRLKFVKTGATPAVSSRRGAWQLVHGNHAVTSAGMVLPG